MESIEQLKQDNAKLQERLNNAAKFFREQKAQIEELTKENKQLKDQVDSCEFAAESDANNLEDLQKQLNEYELKIQELENQLKEVISIEKWNALIIEKENFENVATNKQKVIEKLENDIELKDKAYKNFQDTYNELFSENTKLKDSLTSKSKEYTDLLNDFKNEEEAHKKDIELKNKFSDSCEDLNKSNVELQDKLNKLNKLYDDCENEKLAFQADYESLKEKFDILKIQAEADSELAKKYVDIDEEYQELKSKESSDKELYKFNKDDINDLCDTILDFFKDKNLNKE